MDLATYRQRRIDAQNQKDTRRELCRACLQPGFSCYCQWVESFDPGIQFVILIHPIEVHRRIATGRMAHLNLKNSKLIMGHDFSQNLQVAAILSDPNRYCMMLYPGRKSVNISSIPYLERKKLVPPQKTLSLFVIDGTWGTARTMVRLSENLHHLPRVGFTPTSPSNFRVRKQPRPECYSTIEAIHHFIDLFSPPVGRPHDGLLRCFNKMVDRQIELAGTIRRGRNRT